MKINIADRTKAEFDAAICKAIEDWKRDTNEETVHFTKNSKLDRVTMINSRQELYGHFITSAAVWKIINGIVLEQNPASAYEYKINIKMATYLVKKFLATPNASGEQLIADMSRYLVQVKPDRANVRNLRPTSFVPFNYRVA